MRSLLLILALSGCGSSMVRTPASIGSITVEAQHPAAVSVVCAGVPAYKLTLKPGEPVKLGLLEAGCELRSEVPIELDIKTNWVTR